MFKPTTARTPQEYLESLPEQRKNELKKIHNFITQTLPRQKPIVLSGMIGYGPYHYKYKSGREGDWALILLASQKNYISLYVCSVKDETYIAESYKKDLPRASIGKSCIRFKKFDDVDFPVLKKILLEAESTGAMGAVL